MVKKVFLSLFIFLLIGLPLLLAENHEGISGDQEKVNLALSCLNEKIEQRTCERLSTEEKIFALMATGECRSELINDSSNNECWPKGGCNVKTTAQAILALGSANYNTNDAESWLNLKKISPRDMTWFLQIESNEATSCSISYVGSSYNLEIDEDKKLNSGAGSCLRLSQGGYWLEVSGTSPGCYENEYEISCDKDFFTTLLFRKSGSPTIYVGGTQSSSGGATIEKIEASCFSQSTTCDYEGTLWSSIVLDLQGYDSSKSLPYLITFAEDNKRYLPEAFLYMLTGDTNFRTSLLLKQKASKYWQGVLNNNRFYDTALALFPFPSEDPQEKTNAKNWLLNEAQEDNGCWNSGSIRDTAFILQSIWPGSVFVPASDGGNNDDDGGTTIVYCESQGQGYSCISGLTCGEIGGDILSDYDCPIPYGCCSISAPVETCSSLGGSICDSGERCTGTVDGTVSDLGYGEVCCLVGGFCQEITQDEATCENNGGECRSSFGCDDGEEESNLYSCTSGQFCCFEKRDTSPSSISPWVWILVLLIALVVMGIIFKDSLRRLLFRAKPSGRGGPSRELYGGRPGRRPGYPPGSMRSSPRRLPPSRRPHQNRELDDVLTKLKDMGR